MELVKNIELANGVIASYWKPVRIDLNLVENAGVAEIGGWISAEAYNTGKEPVTTRKVNFNAKDIISQVSTGLDSIFLKVYGVYKSSFAIEDVEVVQEEIKA